nr:immunoglobulin light chain junction region [Macaca mulatta]MOW10853.1 immunoglobulin light chain junction region [Macaca mulatta]MOW14804.1 immunoglobulin light chain junction region [Macaca mulatta]MOW42606.1 immunoglobulin light chain junction region [Macaca mulatta]MOW43155.1 immunoglobulin light chain junction region [Macaca mulatta]
CQQYNDLLYTF